MWCVILQVGEKLGKYEVEKRQAVENEDYDKAKVKKVQMDEYRLKIYKELEIKELVEYAGVSRKCCISIVMLNKSIFTCVLKDLFNIN